MGKFMNVKKEKVMKVEKSLTEELPLDQRSVRAQRRAVDGVQYELRVIEGSNGMLELVEEPSRDKHWFHEWARLMHLSGGMI